MVLGHLATLRHHSAMSPSPPDPSTTPDPQGATDDELQFDRVATSATEADPIPADGRVVCGSCSKVVDTEYYSVQGAPVCQSCKDALVTHEAAAKRWSLVLRAAMFGFGAAVAGAAIYYAVIAITDFEIGIVAILIGYMVGWSVRRGAGGRGGRRFQLLAAGLTYFAVGLAYTPLAFKGAMVDDKKPAESLIADSAVQRRPALPDTPVASAPSDVDAAATSDSAKPGATPARNLGMLLGLGAFFLLVFALPVMAIAGSMPSGLISALIIGIGMQQAWKMTAPASLAITGPYKVGAGPTPASA
jgi:hypothetical protein